MSEAQIAGLDPKVIDVVNAQALLANPSIIGLCFAVLMLAWQGLRARLAWAFWAIAGALVPVQAFGFVSDAQLGHSNLAANLVSTAVLAIGLAFAAQAVFARPTLPVP